MRIAARMAEKKNIPIVLRSGWCGREPLPGWILWDEPGLTKGMWM